MHRLRSFCVLLLLSGGGCDRNDTPPETTAEAPLVEFGTTRLCVLTSTDTLLLSVEVAETEAQRAYGLMERAHLDPDAGMLFTYAEPQPPEHGFWMYRTQIPLDIAFLGPEGEILSLQSMQPCTSPDPRWCPSYPAEVTYRAAVEVNQGFFAAHGITPGDRILPPGEPGCPGAEPHTPDA